MLGNIRGGPSLKVFRQILREYSKDYNDVIPRRSTLYVPGDVNRRIESIVKLVKKNFPMDCVALDCEDAVAMNRKNDARLIIKQFFTSELFTKNLINKSIDWGVRINSAQSGYMEDDIKVLFSSNDSTAMPQTIFMPKVDSTSDLDFLADQLRSTLKNVELQQKINLMFYAESCRAVMDLKEICQHAVKLSQDSECKFKAAGLIFGSDDFIGNLGAAKMKDSSNIMYARQRIPMIAKAFNLQAIDVVYINFKDLKGLLQQSIEGANLGYTGKQVIHPQQIPVVHEGFLPSKEKTEWARQVVASYEEYQKRGVGAFVFDNQMIDEPTVLQCRNILKLSNL